MSRFISPSGEAIADLVELTADDGRLSRGKALFRKGSVSDLVVTEGSITASVRGSQGDDYQATISTTLAPPGVRRQVADRSASGRSVDDLISDGIEVCPREIDLVFDCDCPDWDEPCKHVVAVFLAFADRVDLDDAQLLRWRGLDPPPPSGPTSTTATAPGGGTDPADGPSDGQHRAEVAGARPRRPRSVDGGQAGDDEAGDDEDRSTRLSRLESLLGDTAVRVPAADDRATEPSVTTLEPALADFLGVGSELEPLDVSDLGTTTPLFAGVELGPLADLGPALSEALAIIADRLEHGDRGTSQR